MTTRSITLGAALVAVGAYLVFLLVSGPSQERHPRGASNEIEIIIDGTVVHTWTVKELMKGRFDWETHDGSFFPAVPASFALTAEPVSTSPDRAEWIRIGSKKAEIRLEREDIELFSDLILKLDLEREGTWQLVGRDKAADDHMKAVTGTDRLRKVVTIEVSTRSQSN